MTLWDALILGLVEGLTEFLPISSTGHLVLTSRLLNIIDSDQNKAFEIIIQAGAILAVLFHYRNFFCQELQNLFKRDPKAVALVRNVMIAFIPAAVIGLLASHWIKDHLFGPYPVICALFIGGVAMILIERFLKKRPGSESSSEGAPSGFNALSKAGSVKIGLAQCLALWPGMSRSMTTILGGRLVGLSAVSAAQFSFFLAVPTLIGAAVHDAWKYRHILFTSGNDWTLLIIGSAVSFVVALVVIRSFLKFLGSHSMAVFGWYRIILALTWAALLSLSVLTV